MSVCSYLQLQTLSVCRLSLSTTLHLSQCVSTDNKQFVVQFVNMESAGCSGIIKAGEVG